MHDVRHQAVNRPIFPIDIGVAGLEKDSIKTADSAMLLVLRPLIIFEMKLLMWNHRLFRGIGNGAC